MLALVSNARPPSRARALSAGLLPLPVPVLVLALCAGASATRAAPSSRAPASSEPEGAREVRRLRAHFASALAEVRAHDVTALSVEQRARRAALLDEIERYAARGRFPHNHGRSEHMVPVFIDEHDSPCAVAQMMIAAGDEPLARAIAGEDVTIDLPVDDARILAFAARNGFTVDELARIQPAYGPSDAELACGQLLRSASAPVHERVRQQLESRTDGREEVRPAARVAPQDDEWTGTLFSCLAASGRVAAVRLLGSGAWQPQQPDPVADILELPPPPPPPRVIAGWQKHAVAARHLDDVVSAAAACGTTDPAGMLAVILEQGFVPEQSPRGQRAMYCAAARKDRASLEKLIAAGAPTERGVEAAVDDVELVRWLIKQGVDVRRTTRCVPWQKPRERDLELLRPCLQRIRGDLSEDGWTALHFAALYGSADVASELIERGVPVDAASSEHTTPLMVATYARNQPVIDVLLKAGASKRRKTRAGQALDHFAAVSPAEGATAEQRRDALRKALERPWER